MKRYTFITLVGLSILALAFGINAALAAPKAVPDSQASVIHPDFPLLDADGVNVLESGEAISTMQTCGQCHDTEFIASHAFHSDLGLSDYNANNNGLNSSNGMFGKWDPLTYRFLSTAEDERLDLGTAEWLMLNGARVVGGGPAETSRDGKDLTSLGSNKANPETAILNEDGSVSAWNWDQSGTMEMNCFLCHLESPNNEARVEALQAGEFGKANTATLLGLNIVSEADAGWTYNPEAFNEETGELKNELLGIQDPTNENCAACHGEIHTTEDPLTFTACDLDYPQTATTGQVVSAQRINTSGVNLTDKNELDRSWDVHAERQLQCTDCHYSLNNPSHLSELQANNPEHLVYDPRSLEIGEYLERPDHNFARGQSAQFNIAPEDKGTMRRCENCHDYNEGHDDWLPYIETHMDAVACETCHIPQMYAPAIQSYDWTVITTSGEAASSCRGIEGTPNDVTSLVTGYEPVTLNRTNIDGQQLLAPYNLITSFYWVYDDANGNARPVRQMDLEAVYLENSSYAADIISAFDTNSDGQLNNDELTIDSSAKEETVKSKLTALGLNNPRIEGMIQPYSVNHNVTKGEYAVNDCKDCHNVDSRIAQSIKLADSAPVMPIFDENNNVNGTGELVKGEDGALYYQPMPANDDMYVFGSSRVSWIDWLGALAFVGSLLGVLGHGTLRYLAARKQPKGPARTERVYMYDAYRRFWHWLQTFAIVILLFTGLVIHRPDIFGAFSFRGMVTIHNVVAVVLVVNALLSVFYHIATDRMQEYIPRPYGFFDDAMVQAKYYISGIFKGEPHPFEKTPTRRMNPIQHFTYFGILNVLLPLQMITGALMWGVQKFPTFANALGGLPFLAPFHSLIAWLFATFILVHVYMTTTGATPVEAMRAMVTGYEEVETHEHHEEVKEETKDKKEKK
ncbi:MAG: cytochrome b/b6 domain-containing protein [Anaerolineales bacterium]|nr:cytochrome b/b6 domain-containing protein [Anaerolineales bacterium]